MEKIDNDLYILSKSGAAVLFDNKHGLTAPKAKKDLSDTDKYSVWGDDNLYPQQ